MARWVPILPSVGTIVIAPRLDGFAQSDGRRERLRWQHRPADHGAQGIWPGHDKVTTRWFPLLQAAHPGEYQSSKAAYRKRTTTPKKLVAVGDES